MEKLFQHEDTNMAGKNEKRTIKFSAIHFPDGTIVQSYHHFDRHMMETCKAFGYKEDQIYKAQQGFVDSDGKFLSKKAALPVAKESGQYKSRSKTRRELLLARDIFV